MDKLLGCLVLLWWVDWIPQSCSTYRGIKLMSRTVEMASR